MDFGDLLKGSADMEQQKEKMLRGGEDALKKPSPAMNVFIEDIIIISGKNRQAPEGYQKIDVDLNKGAGGDYLYLCFKQGNDADKAINGLQVIAGRNNGIGAPAGYTRLEQDLNKGAGGRYIYLCIHRGADRPIKDIQIVHGKSKDIAAPNGYTKIEQDLNEKAGGEYIYLCYQQ